MPASSLRTERIPGYCALCIARCGSTAVVTDGRFASLEPDPLHPTGAALCAKGRAAPELVYHPDRLTVPLRRTRPKEDPNPGWQQISWDEALDTIAAQLNKYSEQHGPESVVFSVASPSSSAISDSIDFVERLMNAYGSPNLCGAMELCGWGRYLATTYTFGTSVPGLFMPDLENAGCILYWGYNPGIARLTHATATVAAIKRGARLIVVDPRKAGLASKADIWLRVRPGTDLALALAITHVMIERGWYDSGFVRRWTNAPFLVRSDNGRFLRGSDLNDAGEANCFVASDERSGRLILYDPRTGSYEETTASLALSGEVAVTTRDGIVLCRPAFAHVAEACRNSAPKLVEKTCGIDHEQIESAARMLWESRPVAYYAWSGVEQQTSSTQTARAIAQLYALTGDFDAIGGNVQFASAPAPDMTGRSVTVGRQGPRALGFTERPLGPSRWGFVTTDEVYTAILHGRPYPVKAILGFGANLLLSHADSIRGREALRALEFYAHADVFMNPTAELADIVLPVATAFERESLMMGFDVSARAQAHVQLRPRVVEPRGESRSDTDIIFDLACRMGYSDMFWGGSVEAAYREQLAPSGITLEDLRENPRGIAASVQTAYRKYSSGDVPGGFQTGSRQIELYSEALLEHGYSPVPEYADPLVSHPMRPDLRERFPLILTSAKAALFCESQHRAIPSLRRRAPEPLIEMHPRAAADRGISPGDWVSIDTPEGSVRARARMNDSLDPEVVCGQHGWWQSSSAIGAPAYDPFSEHGANLNLVIGNDAIDPISGSVPHRSYVCQIRRITSNVIGDPPADAGADLDRSTVTIG